MGNQLARMRTAVAHAQTVHYVIQAAFQQHQQVFTRYALHAASLLEVPAELSFQYAIGTARFLLLAQLNAILALFFAANAMLSRGRGAFYNRTFRSKTTIPLKEELSPPYLRRGGVSADGIHCAEWVSCP